MKNVTATETRIASIDMYRGLAIIAMVVGNFLIGVSWVPAWIKHAPDIGFTVADSVAPMFLFAIALNFRSSLMRRIGEIGTAAAFGEKAKRYTALIGIGAIVSYGTVLVFPDRQVLWGVLQAIGFAGLLCLPVVRLGKTARILIALGALAAYQIVLNKIMLAYVLSDSHGGLFGSVAWAALLLLSTVLGEIAIEKRKSLTGAISAILIATGAGLHFFNIVPVSKNRVSASYILLTAGICLFLYFLFIYLFDDRKMRAPIIQSVGRNPITLYILHYLLLAFVMLPANPAWHVSAPVWLVFLQLAIVVGIILFVAHFLDKRRIYISI